MHALFYHITVFYSSNAIKDAQIRDFMSSNTKPLFKNWVLNISYSYIKSTGITYFWT